MVSLGTPVRLTTELIFIFSSEAIMGAERQIIKGSCQYDYQLIHRQKKCQEKNKLILTYFSNIFRYIHV
jgi:hypothetical protein